MGPLNDLEPIPQPDGAPLLGNAFTVDASRLIQELMALAEQHGPIFKLEVMGNTLVFISGADMVAEACDEKRFELLGCIADFLVKSCVSIPLIVG